METKTKAAIINVAIGSWYRQGQKRLVNSLVHHGFNWNVLKWHTWPNQNYDKDCNYNVKAAAFEQAIKWGYSHIVWMDSSVWAIKDPNPIFDIINQDGYYFWANGYNCAQECSDKCLSYFGISRDLAETMPCAATGMFGINLQNPIGKEFIERFIAAAKHGVFSGSRLHDDQSSDHRFLHHRQDQSAASIILNQLGCKIHEPGKEIMYYQEKDVSESVMFFVRGM